MSRPGAVVNRKALRRPSIMMARVQVEGVNQRGWLKIRQGSFSIYQRRWVVASGHYIQVFALDAPGSAPLSALDLRGLTLDEKQSNENEFELRDASGTAFGFQATDADTARTWVQVIGKLIEDCSQTDDAAGGTSDGDGTSTPGPSASSPEVRKKMQFERMMAQKNSSLAAKKELEAIDATAKRRAAAAIADTFHDANDLRGLESYEEEIQAKLSSVSRAVDASFAKQDSRAQLILKRVGQSGTGVTSIRGSMSELQKAVHESSFWSRDQGVSAARDLVGKAQMAKNNLGKTLELCHQWLSVPSRVKQLRAALDKEPLMLLAVFTELIDLEAWRKALRRLLRSLHSPSASASASSSLTLEKLAEVSIGFVAHMGSVSELAEAVREKLWQNVRRFFELGTTNPAVLVMTFQVIEERELNKEARREAAARKLKLAELARKEKAESGASWASKRSHHSSESQDLDDDDEDDDEEDVDYRSKGTGVLHETIALRAEGAFKQFHKPSGGEGDRVGLALSAASHVLSELTIMVKEVAPCVPKDYAVVVLARNMYQSHLMVQLEAIYSRPSALSTMEILKVIEWLDYYESEMNNLLDDDEHAGGVAAGCEEFKQAADKLLTEYMARMREQLSGWVDTVQILDGDLVKDKDDRTATAYPNDLMRLMRLQLDTASRLLKPHRFVWVLGPAAMSLRTSQMVFDDLVHSAHASLAAREEAYKRGAEVEEPDHLAQALTVERLVGISNDLVRLSSLMSSYRDELFSSESERALKAHESGISIAESLSGFDDASREYLELSFKAVSLLARTMLLDLLPTIAGGIGTPMWEDATGGAVPVETLVATLADYFGEFEDLSDDYLWPRCTKACAVGLLSAYLEHLAGKGAEDESEEQRGSMAGKALAAIPGTKTASKAVIMANIFTKRPKKTLEEGSEGEGGADAAANANGVADMLKGVGEGATEMFSDMLNGTNKTASGPVPFRNREATARRLKSDMACLVEFFESVEDLDLNRMEVHTFFSPLKHIADIVRAPSAAEAETSTTELMRVLLRCDLVAFPASKQELFQETFTGLVTSIWRRRGIRDEAGGGGEKEAEEYGAIVAGLF